VPAPAAIAAAPPIQNLAPSDGAVIELPSRQDVTLNFTCPRYTTSFHSTVSWSSYFTEVATSPELGPDGTLATPFTVWSSASFPTNAAETECRASFTGFRAYDSPGTYYWQVNAVDCDLPNCTNAGPVWRLTTRRPSSPPPPLPPAPPTQPTSPNPPSLRMTGRQAARYARKMIGRETNGRVVGLKRASHVPRTAPSVVGGNGGLKAGNTQAGQRFGTGRMANTRWWEYEFTGQRRRSGCSSRCVRSLSW